MINLYKKIYYEVTENVDWARFRITDVVIGGILPSTARNIPSIIQARETLEAELVESLEEEMVVW